MSTMPEGFTRDLPVLTSSFATTRLSPRTGQVVMTGNYWVQEREGDTPAPACVRFVNGKPESVHVLGRMSTFFPTMIYSWGPSVVYDGDKGATLAQARERMFSLQEANDNLCPCCHQLVKLYRRKLHTEMALFLIKLVKAYQKSPRWYSTRELLPATAKSATDGAYLTRWGLVEKMPSMNSSGGKAGMYKPTDKGIKFALGQDFVPSHVHILCGKVVGFSETVTNIQQCLGRKFNYSELMLG